jgi:spermidine synthase
MAPPHFSPVAFYVLFVASGFAGLIYESVWTHYLKLYLGHAAYAQSLVLIVFMGGMAIGAAVCARVSTRIRNPLAAYAAVEAVIGVCALVFHEVFVAATDWSYAAMLPALGAGWPALAAKLALASALILPQSILLGATFPLMSAGLVRASMNDQRRTPGEAVAMLYFANSLGAAAGVLVSGFILIAWVGLPGTLRSAGVVNLVLAAVVALLARPARASPPITPRGGKSTGEASQARLLLAVALLTGLASFIYEVCWIRMLSLVLGASTHSFELMLSTFILGLALGGLAVRRLVDRASSPEQLLGWVQVAMGVLALATLPVYDQTFELMQYFMKGLARTDAGYLLFNLAGQSVSAVVMLPATFCAGMTLPLITGALLRAGAGERAIGQVYAANTVGAIGGVLLAVHAGLPLLGLKGTLVFGALIDTLLGLALLQRFASGKTALAVVSAACVLPFAPVALLFKLDVNKMTAGVFRHGDLSASADAEILFAKDGKTATVHLVRYADATSIRTNGKSDGSINLNPAGARGSDEITMTLTAAVPLAIRPEAKTAAVIGIGTGLTMHTLLQDLSLEAVETVEIEAAMAEAARGFAPRNNAAFLDPRGSIWIDDAKTFFATRGRRYDILISEPSNPWVSGVAGLFTSEFYQRVRGHLNPGGILVQWFQLYEIDPSLLASVMRALGEAFPHYVMFAPSDHDVLIIASANPIPLPPKAAVFEHPGLARELRTVHVLAPGDLDARYLGDRATLEPLFDSYGMPANSDYYPVLDLNAAKDRFTEKSASDVVALLNAGVPVLDMLQPALQRRAVNPLHLGAATFERVENTRLARYARDVLLGPKLPEPEGIPTLLEKDLELSKLRLIECREPREQDVWLHSMINVARAVNPYLAPAETRAVWARFTTAACFVTLREYQRRWILLFAAVGVRDAASSAELASALLATQDELSRDAREYLLMAGMAGHIAAGNPQRAKDLWTKYEDRIRGAGKPAFRLLRCRAEAGNPAACAAAFAPYARG